MMVLTFLVWTYMYARRIRFINSTGLDTQDLAAPGKLAAISPPAVSNPSDNLKNLFEMPVLFYALCLYLYVTEQVDALYVGAAWTFVASRALHSIVHSTFNRVIVRFGLYFVSSLALAFMTIRAAIGHFAPN
jgi:hypothetical protein